MDADPADFLDNLNALSYIINNIVNKVNTVELVRVVAVNIVNNTIDVIPIIKNINADNKPINESIIYGVRYFQWQYGLNSIIATPEIGDVGMICICKKDISSAEIGLAGSKRKYCLADGIYIGGILGLNAIPIQFIKFDALGITITSPTAVTINTPLATVNAIESATLNTQIATVNATTSATLTTPIATVNAITSASLISPLVNVTSTVVNVAAGNVNMGVSLNPTDFKPVARIGEKIVRTPQEALDPTSQAIGYIGISDLTTTTVKAV